MSEATENAAAETAHEPTREVLELAGRDAIHRFLGNPSGQAHDMARDLTDAELHALAAAARGRDRPKAVATIKDTLNASYERKRKEHEQQAREDMQTQNTRAAAVRVLIAHGRHDRLAREDVAHLDSLELKLLAAVEGETDAGPVIASVMARAAERGGFDANEIVLAASSAEVTVTVGTGDGTLVPDYEGNQAAYDTGAAEPVEAVAEIPTEATPAAAAPAEETAEVAQPEPSAKPTSAAEAPKPAAVVKPKKPTK